MAAKLNRRMVLRGLAHGAAVSVALPPLEAMLNAHGTAYADGSEIPCRFGAWWWGNGVRREHWLPSNPGPNFDLKAETMPFAPVKDYMTMLTGFDLPTNDSAHNSGYAWMAGGHSDHSKTYHTPGSLAYSCDQIVADAWAGQTAIHSLQLGVSRMGYEGNAYTGNASYARGGNQLRNDFDPTTVFDRLFGNGPVEASQEQRRAMARLRDRRASVLDAVTRSSRTLEARISSADRARLDQHFTAIRELETKLTEETDLEAAPACNPSRPTVTGTPNGAHNSPEPLEETHDAMSELIRLAFACDLTRVFTMQLVKFQGSTIFWQVGTDRQFHDITHDGPQSLVHEINKFMFAQFSKLLVGLRNTPVGAGNLLDHCCILGASEVGEGSGHQTNNLPMVLFGKAGGRLAGNNVIDGGGATTSRAILGAIHSVGVQAESFAANEGRATNPYPLS